MYIFINGYRTVVLLLPLLFYFVRVPIIWVQKPYENRLLLVEFDQERGFSLPTHTIGDLIRSVWSRLD